MYEKIPKELKKVKQWVCWSGDKLPKNPHTGGSVEYKRWEKLAIEDLLTQARKQAVEEFIQAITEDVDATYHTATSTYVDIDDIHHIAIDKFGVEL